ncbi:ABC transporter permease [Kiloniella sp. b19]|uniref:ABC transporter permease n=1 Tax=Kiloniella sp. GXU_MW_B19 TaxID=3141326 RepID=UPI0031DF50BF
MSTTTEKLLTKTDRNNSALKALLLFTLLLCLFGAGLILTPYDPVQADFLHRLTSPSASHWFGTDHLGRDIATRLLYGAGWSVGLAFLVSSLGAIIGTAVGLLAGAGQSWLDSVLMRVTDSFFAFPELVAAIAIAGILGPSTNNMILALTLVSWMRYARLVRTLTREISHRDFILQARLNRLPQWLVFWCHYLPNIRMSLLVLWTSLWSRTILAISGLSFLGFGVQPPKAEWGAMLLDGKPYMQSAPHVMIFPGVAILITVLALNLIGDHLRDRLNKQH